MTKITDFYAHIPVGVLQENQAPVRMDVREDACVACVVFGAQEGHALGACVLASSVAPTPRQPTRPARDRGGAMLR